VLTWLKRSRVWPLRVRFSSAIVGPGRGRRHLRPEFSQAVNACIGRIAGNDRRVDRADGDAGDPVGVDVGLCQSLVDTSLVCPQRTAALQDKGDTLEREAAFGNCEVRTKLKVHVVISCVDVLLHGRCARAEFKETNGLRWFVLEAAEGGLALAVTGEDVPGPSVSSTMKHWASRPHGLHLRKQRLTFLISPLNYTV
jgi:hypothetical protein